MGNSKQPYLTKGELLKDNHEFDVFHWRIARAKAGSAMDCGRGLLLPVVDVVIPRCSVRPDVLDE